MENTGKVLFEDDTPHWYIALGTRWVGPLSASDVYLKVTSQEISWAHFVWRPGQADWKRICDTPTFQTAVPSLPSSAMTEAIKEASKPQIKTAAPRSGAPAAPKSPKSAAPKPPAPRKEELRDWFLYYNDSQFGPFSDDEVSRYLRVGKIHGRVHAWRDGMDDWVRLETIARFEDDCAEAKSVRAAKKKLAIAPASPGHAPKPMTESTSAEDKRKTPRRPLIAKILMADHRQLTIAVCRDISVGGMQVLTDRLPGQPGSRIKMNVSPAGGRLAKGSKAIEPFVAEGVIVRILEDGRGFSFRFDKLPDASRRAIEDYIK